MTKTPDSPTPRTFHETFSESLEKAVFRFRGSSAGLLQGGTVAGAMTLASVLGVTGCGTEATVEPQDPSREGTVGKQDWAQDQGQRDPSMVTYLNSYWYDYSDCGSRFGCQSVDVFLKLQVKRVPGANLAQKRVGVEVHPPGQPSRTALATYYSTIDSNYEEWHALVNLRTWDVHPFIFNAWYQDGLGHTFYDDNDGEFFPISYDGSYSVIRQDSASTKVQVGAAGIHGKVSIILADLAYDKDVRIIYTTDDWKTPAKTIPMGVKGQANAIYFDSALGGGMERWAADLGLPGAVSRMQYAIVYKHGVVHGAKTFEFWDNNAGQNYLVTAP